MEQVKNESGYYSTAIYCRLSKNDEQSGDMLDADSYHEMLGEYTPEQKRINERLEMIEN